MRLIRHPRVAPGKMSPQLQYFAADQVGGGTTTLTGTWTGATSVPTRMPIEPLLVPGGSEARCTTTFTTTLCPISRNPSSTGKVSQGTDELARHDPPP